ncbi:MAG: hypothetical protein L0Z73_00555 [Gammaproteobacteria bacterium]|nr:hypothetical protein [Gammaproteobacteria bacterium]
MSKSRNGRARLTAAMLAVAGTAMSMTAQAGGYESGMKKHDDTAVQVTMFAPAKGDRVGIGGRGWFVDLAIEFDTTLDKTGFSNFQLTGPAGHNNIDPFPGTFSTGADDRLPGLIVLVSTTTSGAMSCQNIANLFNLTGVTNVTESEVELWDTWLVGAPNFGVDTQSDIYVAVADDLNGDGIYNDAPGAVPDSNGDGICNTKDLKAFGVASNIAKTRFYINP